MPRPASRPRAPRRSVASSCVPATRRSSLSASKERHRRAIGVRRGEGVVDLGHRDDPGDGRDLGPGQPAWVAAAVDALVVGADDVRHRPVDAEVAQELGADLGMAAYAAPVGLLEHAAALHDAVGERELADVVQQSGRVRELLLARRQAELPGEVAREGGDRGAVARGARVALVERADQPAEHAPRQVRVLARALAGRHDEPRHVREGDHREQDEREGREAELGVDRRRDCDQGRVDGEGGPERSRTSAAAGATDWPSSTAMSGPMSSTLSSIVATVAHGEHGPRARRCPGRGRALRRRPRRQAPALPSRRC